MKVFVIQNLERISLVAEVSGPASGDRRWATATTVGLTIRAAVCNDEHSHAWDTVLDSVPPALLGDLSDLGDDQDCVLYCLGLSSSSREPRIL